MKFAGLLLVLAATVSTPFVINAQTKPASDTTSVTTSASDSTLPVDQQATKEQIDQLFAVMHNHEMVEKMLKDMVTMLKQQINQQMQQTMQQSGASSLPPETMEKFEKIMDKYMDKTMSVFSVDEMLNDMSTVYQHHLTKTDVEAMIVFYKTPAGQHLLSEMPAIMKDYMAMIMPKMQNRQADLIAQMSKEIQDLIVKPSDLKSAPVKN